MIDYNENNNYEQFLVERDYCFAWSKTYEVLCSSICVFCCAAGFVNNGWNLWTSQATRLEDRNFYFKAR